MCMKSLFALFLALCLISFTVGDFKTDQLRYSRVRTAFAEKEKHLNEILSQKGLSTSQLQLAIFAYKNEKKVEVWATNTNEYQLIKTYDFCSTSGSLGPKRQQGDMQIPEGLYHIDRFNPASNFYLSLGINYPNSSDRMRANGNAGGDIFIHGDCVTIGCIPITDDKIKELYALCVLAKDQGQNHIPVNIFPFKMSD